MTTQVVILAAGMGSRLGRCLPKPLTELSDGRTIMQQQFDNIHARLRQRRQGDDRRRLQARAHHRGVPRRVLRLQRAVRPDQHLEEPAARPPGLRPRRRALDERRRRLRPDRARPRRRHDRPRPVVRHRQHRRRSPTKRSSTRPAPRASSTSCRRQVKGGLGEAVGINYVSSADKAALIRQLAARRRPGLLRARHRARHRAGRACSSSRSTSPTSTRSRSTSPRTSSARTFSSSRTGRCRARSAQRSRDQYDGFRDQYIR